MTLLEARDPGQAVSETHSGPAGVAPSPQSARHGAPPRVFTPAADLLDPGHVDTEAHARNAGVDLLAADQKRCASQSGPVGGDPSQPPVGHVALDTHQVNAGGWLELRMVADAFEDVLGFRKATSNRLRALERRGEADVKNHPFYGAYLASIKDTEKLVRKALTQTFRRVVPDSIQQWVETVPGLGEHTVGRLLGRIGDPCIARPHHWEGTGKDRVLVNDEPYYRTVSQLWQYCGHGDPKRSRAWKGITADELAGIGNPVTKSIVFNIAEATMKCRTRYPNVYGDIYDEAKAAYADRVHGGDCPQCLKDGKPGLPWRPGHQHAAALRRVGKEILRDLWRVRHAELFPPAKPDATPTRAAPAGLIEGNPS